MFLKQSLLANVCRQREGDAQVEFRELSCSPLPRQLPHVPAWGITAGTGLISSSNTERVIWNIYEAPNLS